MLFPLIPPFKHTQFNLFSALNSADRDFIPFVYGAQHNRTSILCWSPLELLENNSFNLLYPVLVNEALEGIFFCQLCQLDTS